MTITMQPIAFYILASITTTMVVLLIVQKNPLSSAVCLVTSFFSLAGIYILLDAHFVATMQILVYAGAIMVLFIFVIMLLNLKEHELTEDKFNLKRAFVLLLGLGLFGFLSWQFLKIPQDSTKPAFPALTPEFGTVKEVGKLLFGNYVVAFEIIGVLLLVGMVGAILLGRREE